MATLDFESDQMLRLLTDALRAGPGSPEWHEAVGRLRGGGAEVDEYRLLCEARERLESGKAYRSVQAGPGFTRRVLQGVEEESIRGRSIPLASLIAMAAGVVLVVVLGCVGYVLLRGTNPPATNLADLYFGARVFSSSFNGTLPPEWNTFGALPVNFQNGLRPEEGGEEYRGGGIVSAAPIPPRQPVALEVALRMPRLDDKVIVQVFVTDQPEFSEERATSAHELVWWVQSARPQVVLPSGRIGATGEKIKAGSETQIVRIALDRDNAVIDHAGQQLWSGSHQLDPDKPRHVGVRFLRRGADKGEFVVVQSVRLLRP